MAAVSELVDVSQCSWQVEKERETTARIVAWRHLNVTTSSTLECSLAGSDRSSLLGLRKLVMVAVILDENGRHYYANDDKHD